MAEKLGVALVERLSVLPVSVPVTLAVAPSAAAGTASIAATAMAKKIGVLLRRKVLLLLKFEVWIRCDIGIPFIAIYGELSESFQSNLGVSDDEIHHTD